MKFLIAILALTAVAHADVSHILSPEATAEVISQQADVYPDQYQFGYQTSNGIQAQESGVLRDAGQENAAIEAQGSNSYTGPDGQVYSITYVADKNGYQPQGDHLPTPPPTQPIPEYIARSIEYIRTHASASETQGFSGGQ